METEKYPIRLPYKAKVSADGTGYLRSAILKVGQVLECQSIAFRNQTEARGTVEIYIKAGASLIFLCDQTTPEANTWYWYPYTQTIKEGEQIEARQASCIENDILDLHIIGHITYGKEGKGKPTAASTPEPARVEQKPARYAPIVRPGRSKSAPVER